MKALATAVALAGVLGANTCAQAALATFDDLPTLPGLTGSTGLSFANGGSSVYDGVVWDSRFDVGGALYRTQPNSTPPGPLYGIPHSGSYYLTNASQDLSSGTSNNGLLITTTQVLAGAYFGRNEYYGYGAGADQITISALSGNSVIGIPLVFDLPELRHNGPISTVIGPGEPELLTFVDTSSFAGLSGITGYRIDRREGPAQGGQWVADDFNFVLAAPVPEPETWATLLAGLGLLAVVCRRRTQRAVTPPG